MTSRLDIQSPVPFWFVNGRIDRQDVSREFEMMHEKGIGELVVHPRHGMELEYLSDEWFEFFGWCVAEAKSRGMRLWIYDEMNWPSGTAGMRVMQQNPEYRSKFIEVRRMPADVIGASSSEPADYLVAAKIVDGEINETRQLLDWDIARALSPDWTLFACSKRFDPQYVDTLSKDAIDCFKLLTYEAYYNLFGDEFGKTIRAIFTDEPSIYWVTAGYDNWNVPYTDDMFDLFEENFGYSAIPMIPYLFFPGREASRFREHFWSLVSSLFNERYHANLGGWCQEHNVIYTGHNNHEEPLRYQIRFQGDMFGTMREMDIPGVDHLTKTTLGNHWISIIGHKICSSSARISGKARCMSESFGCMDWDTTYTHLKRVTDWQYALGIDLLVPHALFHTISGPRKRESPPSFFYQSPHWEDFGYFSEYLKNLEAILAGSESLARVAVLYPLSGLWRTYQPDRLTSEFERIESSLNSLCLDLIKHQIDFELVDECYLTKRTDGAEVSSYNYLIVPPVQDLSRELVDRIVAESERGTNVVTIISSAIPETENAQILASKTMCVPSAGAGDFINTLRAQLNDNILISGGATADIMIRRVIKDGRESAFLLNRSEKHRKVTVTLKPPTFTGYLVFDQETGETWPLEARRTGAKLQAQLRFEPGQSFFIVTGDLPIDRNVPPACDMNSSECKTIQINDLQAHVPHNVACIYGFERTQDAERSPFDVRTDPRGFPAQWADHQMDYSKWAGTYEARVTVNCPTDGIRLVLDSDYADCLISLNGEPVVLQPCIDSEGREVSPPILDRFDLYALVGSPLAVPALRPGENLFTVTSPTKLSEPLRLVGAFGVVVDGDGITLAEPCDMDPLHPELTHPFFSGTTTYTGSFEMDTLRSPAILDLREARDSAEVWVNNVCVGRRLWQPYRFDITAAIRPGVNILEIKTRNNLANLINGAARPYGLRREPFVKCTVATPPDDGDVGQPVWSNNH